MRGSVFQRASDGRWVAQVSLGTPPNRRRVARYVRTQAEAEAALPELLVETGQTLAARFWAKVDRTGECWNWAGQLVRGYGYFGSGRQRQRAHRVAWELTEGAIPDGLSVLHSCDNPRCVRPAHLRLGTQADNMRDRDERRHHVAT